jgi:hypothetical protein
MQNLSMQLLLILANAQLAHTAMLCWRGSKATALLLAAEMS